MSVGRKKIYESPEERRKHLRVIYTRVGARDRLKAQAKKLGIAFIDYMDRLAATHDNYEESRYKIVTDSGYSLYITPELMIDLLNGDVKDKTLETVLMNATPDQKPAL